MKESYCLFIGAIIGVFGITMFNNHNIYGLKYEQKAIIKELQLLHTHIQALDNRSHKRELELQSAIELASPQKFIDRRN